MFYGFDTLDEFDVNDEFDVRNYVDNMVEEVKRSGQQVLVLWDDVDQCSSAMIFVPHVFKNAEKQMEVITVDENGDVVTNFLSENAVDTLMGYFKVNDY